MAKPGLQSASERQLMAPLNKELSASDAQLDPKDRVQHMEQYLEHVMVSAMGLEDHGVGARSAGQQARSVLDLKWKGQQVMLDNPTAAFSMEKSERKSFERETGSRYALRKGRKRMAVSTALPVAEETKDTVERTVDEKAGGIRRKRRRGGPKMAQSQRSDYDVASFAGLHALWKQYMATMIQNSKSAPIEQLIAKGDLHGAILRVQRSKSPQLVGVVGLVIEETENCFKLLGHDHHLRVIPKPHSVFTVNVEGKTATIFGNHFCFRSYERSARKFKTKQSIDL